MRKRALLRSLSPLGLLLAAQVWAGDDAAFAPGPSRFDPAIPALHGVLEPVPGEIGGYFGEPSLNPLQGVARWDGSTWRLLGDRVRGRVQAMTVVGAVYDARGREVAVLQDGAADAGIHAMRWDGRDRSGRRVPVGVYFVSIRGPEGDVASRKIVHLR